MSWKWMYLLLLLLPSAGCMEVDDFYGNAGQGAPVGTSYVNLQYGFSPGGVDYVLIVVYDTPSPKATVEDDRYRLLGSVVELDAGGQCFDNIRDTNTLYILRGENLETYELRCTEGDIAELTFASYATADDLVDDAIAKLAKDVKPVAPADR